MRGCGAVLLLVSTLCHAVKSDESCDIDVEKTLKTLLSPIDYPTLQEQALRRDLLRRLQEAVEDDKRSISALAKWNNLPDKRNLEALARAGLVRTLPLAYDDDKRSVATLAKNGQLPNTSKDAKRGIESLARNGELHARRDLQELLDELHDKRNIGSLARTFNLPSSYGKRNVAALARNGGFRTKRETGYDDDVGEYPLPVYQNQNVDDYEELLKALTGVYPTTDKRFLGRLPQMGKPKTTQSPKTRFH